MLFLSRNVILVINLKHVIHIYIVISRLKLNMISIFYYLAKRLGYHGRQTLHN